LFDCTSVLLILLEVTTDTPGLMQFKYKGQFVIQTAWVSWCSVLGERLLCQWFSVRVLPTLLFFLYFFSSLRVTFPG